MKSDFNSILELYPKFSRKNRLLVIENLEKSINSITYSHKINNRLENQYLDLHHVILIKSLFNFAYKAIKNSYDEFSIVPCKELGFLENEFWFNIAKPGESTGWHDHKQKSFFSCVYYLQTKKLSGNLKFRSGNQGLLDILQIEPEEGKMVLFNSSLSHAVDINRSSFDRISLAFNLFKLPIENKNHETTYSTSNFY